MERGPRVSEAVQESAAGRPVFSPLVALAVVAVGALSLLFYLVFAAYAPDLSGDYDGRANALSRSAVGFAALSTFLRDQDIPVLMSRGLSEDEMAKASLIILTPGIENSGKEALEVTTEDPKLIILPKWVALSDPLHPGWVQNGGLIPPSALAMRLLESFSKSSQLASAQGSAAVRLHNGFDGTELTTGAIQSWRTISGPDWTGNVTDAENRSVVARLTGTRLYVLSDPDLMNTHGLKDLATARAAAAIVQGLRIGQGPVLFDLTLSGYRRSPNLLRLVFEPPLLGATLCALFAALLMGIHAATRFGAPLASGRVFALGKQALADNSAALIAMTRREHRILPRYAAAIRRRVARIVGAPADARDDDLNAVLDEMRRRNEAAQPLADLMAEASRAADEADALRVARKLHRWRREMIHER
jgi:hypothetical protein